jgi:hypothetical protein
MILKSFDINNIESSFGGDKPFATSFKGGPNLLIANRQSLQERRAS